MKPTSNSNNYQQPSFLSTSANGMDQPMKARMNNSKGGNNSAAMSNMAGMVPGYTTQQMPMSSMPMNMQMGGMMQPMMSGPMISSPMPMQPQPYFNPMQMMQPQAQASSMTMSYPMNQGYPSSQQFGNSSSGMMGAGSYGSNGYNTSAVDMLYGMGGMSGGMSGSMGGMGGGMGAGMSGSTPMFYDAPLMVTNCSNMSNMDGGSSGTCKRCGGSGKK